MHTHKYVLRIHGVLENVCGIVNILDVFVLFWVFLSLVFVLCLRNMVRCAFLDTLPGVIIAARFSIDGTGVMGTVQRGLAWPLPKVTSTNREMWSSFVRWNA